MPIPTILTRIEGENYFVYTTDIVDQRGWERGGTFPAGVADIRDVLMVGGNCVCAVADMNDGTYSVIRSLDLTKTWNTVWTHTPRIHMMRLYDNGWILLCAEDGWYQSTQSGYNFTYIGTGPRARNLVYCNDDRIIVHDGEKLWLSTDDAVTWAMIQDLRAQSPTDPIRAALATSSMYVLAGAGGRLWRSPDWGISWGISYTFDAGEYIQSISPMNTTAMDSDFMLVTHRTTEGTNRTYYSADAGKTWTPKIDAEYSPYARAATTHIKTTGSPTTETTADVAALVAGYKTYPTIYKTVNGLTWSDKFVWPNEG